MSLPDKIRCTGTPGDTLYARLFDAVNGQVADLDAEEWVSVAGADAEDTALALVESGSTGRFEADWPEWIDPNAVPLEVLIYLQDAANPAWNDQALSSECLRPLQTAVPILPCVRISGTLEPDATGLYVPTHRSDGALVFEKESQPYGLLYYSYPDLKWLLSVPQEETTVFWHGPAGIDDVAGEYVPQEGASGTARSELAAHPSFTAHARLSLNALWRWWFGTPTEAFGARHADSMAERIRLAYVFGVAVSSRLGVWAGNGINTVLGAFKALFSKSAELPTDIGGTMNPATDSIEALGNLTKANGPGDLAATKAAAETVAALVAKGAFTEEALANIPEVEVDETSIANATWAHAIAVGVNNKLSQYPANINPAAAIYGGIQQADIACTVFKGGTAPLMARVYDHSGALLTQEAVEEITYSIYLLDDRDADSRKKVQDHQDVDLDAEDVVFDTLQTDVFWTYDTTGYNLRFVPDVAEKPAFAIAGRRYLVECLITPAEGQVIVVRWRVNVI